MTCVSCGGIIGQDCFNPEECAEITRAKNIDLAVKQSGKMSDYAAALLFRERLHMALETMEESAKSIHELNRNGPSEINGRTIVAIYNMHHLALTIAGRLERAARTLREFDAQTDF